MPVGGTQETKALLNTSMVEGESIELKPSSRRD